jgi:deoxyribose-phosphate aldolase
MYTEYYINAVDEKDLEIKQNIENLIQYTSIKNIVSTSYQAKYIKKNFNNLQVGSFIDYPVANSEPASRQEHIKNSLAQDLDFVCVTIQSYYLINRKYDKIRDDIKKNLDLCQNKQLRYILEYRKFDHQILAKACEILISCGVNIIYPSTGFFIDNLDDNILACQYLNKKTGINTIINGNTWTKKQIDQVVKSNLYGFSCNNIYCLKMMNNG